MDNDDLPVGRLLSRREALRVLGGISFVPLAGSAARPDSPRGDASSLWIAPERTSRSVAARSAALGQQMCVVRPAQTLGPYYVDHLLDRNDIRTDPPGSEMTPGIPLELTMNVSRIAGSECIPYEGAIVDLWQCDAAGIYSGVNDPRFNTVGQRWLRGFQAADARGQVHFTTIYPGWYRGRTVHIHFKVRTGTEAGAREFVSQLYFDDSFTDRVFARAPYSAQAGQRARNEGDNIFRNSGGSQLMLDVAEAGEGFRATFNLGVQI
ncbi:MAG: intradiol ring-cleavage dioxygenase [Gemmatimonadota bacterium]